MVNKKENLLWGTYTWILFHWLAENIKDSEFIEERENLIRLIHDICGHLPCPNCSEHAMDYLKDNRLSLIKTKEDLKIFLFHFHNSVNKRGRKNFEHYDILEKYKKVNYNLMLDQWNIHFSLRQNINKNDFMAKQNLNRIKSKVLNYISTNLYKFLTS